MLALDETFGAPVIESYGMTEATHQMTSNPLPPRRASRARWAWPPGRRSRIVDEAEDRLLAQGAVGEIVIRGPNVTPGYEGNPEANAKASSGRGRAGSAPATRARWTTEGYLTLTGRLKEIINRGGEKVSPLEVDERADGPSGRRAGGDLRACRTPKLGEEVAAAVVLREGAAADERDIRDFCRGAARGLQGAAPGGDPRRDPEGGDRQAAAHRAGGEAGAGWGVSAQSGLARVQFLVTI